MTVKPNVVGGLAAAVAAGAALLALLTGPAAGGPSDDDAAEKSDGTVQTDGHPFDNALGNDPHVGCEFQIDLDGYVPGSYRLTLRIHPPSGEPAVLLRDDLVVEAGGSGNATQRYDLQQELLAYEEHPQQGYHVKLTVAGSGSTDAGDTHKVFWVEGCDARSGGS